MSVNSINSVSQSGYALSTNYSQSATRQAQCAAPPPDGGGGGPLLGAIANALQSLGQSSSRAASTDLASLSSSDSSGDSSSDTSSSNAAQALGSFLQKLMAALQEVSGSKSQGEGPPPPPPPAINAGADGGPLAKDLQKLIANLSSQSASDTSSTSSTATSTENSTSTETTAVTETANTDLSSSFNQLLDALGLSQQNSSQALQNFLQSILTQVSQHGRQGNFVDTSA